MVEIEQITNHVRLFFFVFNIGNERFGNMEMGRVLKVENTKFSILISVEDNGFEKIFWVLF